MNLDKETGVLLRSIEESVYAGIFNLQQALEKAFAGGVLRGKVEGLSTARKLSRSVRELATAMRSRTGARR